MTYSETVFDIWIPNLFSEDAVTKIGWSGVRQSIYEEILEMIQPEFAELHSKMLSRNEIKNLYS